MLKTCGKCKEAKETTEFNKNRTRIDGLANYCRVCDKALNRGGVYKDTRKKYQEDNKEKLKANSRRFHYQNKYGLSLEQYDDMRIQQDHRCYICNEHELDTHRKVLCVDHDHDTGEVRKLLCSKCNQGLGLFNDSSGLLAKASKYLETYGKP